MLGGSLLRTAHNSGLAADGFAARSIPTPLCGPLVSCREDNIYVDPGPGKHAHQGSRLLRLLLKGMQDVDSFCELRHVEAVAMRYEPRR